MYTELVQISKNDSKTTIEKQRQAGKQMQTTNRYRSVLLIRGFCICEFIDLLKFICNPKSILLYFLWSFMDMIRAAKKIELPDVHLPS